jgi:hypothetical protein
MNTRNNLSSKRLALLTIVCMAFPLSAVAEDDYDQLNDPFRIYLGAFAASVSSKININGEILPPGPPISIEDQLGVEDSKEAVWGGVQWRISQRNSLEFESFSLNRDGGQSGTFEPPIQAGDTIIESGAIGTSFDTGVSRLTYGFSLKRSERSDLQIMGGLHIASFNVGLQLSGNVCNPTTTPTVPPGCPTASTGVASEEVTAPLPHFGLSYAYAFSPSLALRLKAIGFAIEIESIEGSILEADADLTWQPTRHFGAGIGVRYFNTNVKSTGSDLNGEFDYEYVGPVVFIQASF